MHTLQHGLIAILTDSCSTVVPQYKKRDKFNYHTQWATCDEAKLQNSLKRANRCSVVQSVLRGHCESCAGPTECEFSVSHQCFLHTHPQPRYAYMSTMPTFFFPLSYLLVSCFFFFHVPLHMIIIHVLQTLQAKPYLWNGKLRKTWTGKCLVDNLMVEWPVELSALAAADNWKTWWIFISSSHDC